MAQPEQGKPGPGTDVAKMAAVIERFGGDLPMHEEPASFAAALEEEADRD